MWCSTGSLPEGSDAYGHTQWSHYAVSNGWYYNDGPWSSRYYYDAPAFIEAVQWYADLAVENGYAPAVRRFPAWAAMPSSRPARER